MNGIVYISLIIPIMHNAFLRLFFLYVLAISPAFIEGQSVIPTYTEPIQFPDQEVLDQYFYVGDSAVVISRVMVLHGHHIYKPGLELDNYKKVSFPFEKSNPGEFISREGRLFRFLVKKDKKNKKLHRAFAEYKMNGKAIGAKKLSSFKYQDENALPVEVMYESPDSSHICMISVEDEDHKKRQYKLHLALIDPRLKATQTFSYAPEVKKSQKLYDLITARVNNDGEVYVLQKVYDDKHEEAILKNSEYLANYSYELLCMNKDGKVSVHKLDNQQKFASCYQIFLNAAGKPIVVTGINSGPRDDAGLLGMNIHTMVEDSFQTQKHLFPSRAMKSWGFGHKASKNGPGNFFTIHYDYLVNEDKIHFLLERQFSITRKQVYKNSNRSGLSRQAIAVSMGNDGKVLDYMYVPKSYEVSGYDAPASKLVEVDSVLYLAYMDKKANINHPIKKLEHFSIVSPAFYQGDNIAVLAYKNSKGKVERMSVPKSENITLLTDLHCIKPNGEIEFPFLVEKVKGGSRGLGLLSLEILKK